MIFYGSGVKRKQFCPLKSILKRQVIAGAVLTTGALAEKNLALKILW